MEHDDNSYMYPIAGDGEEVQWDLLVKHGVLTPAQAEFLRAEEKPAKRPATRIIKGMRRLELKRALALANRVLAEPPRPNRGFAQRMVDYAAEGGQG